MPANALLRAGYDVQIQSIQHWLADTHQSRVACSKANVIVLQRVLIDESINRALFWKAKGKAVVADWDDSYQHIFQSTGNPAEAFWGRGEITVNTAVGSYKSYLDKHPLDQFAHGLSKITAGAAPSRVICEDYREIVPMFHLPNYFATEPYLKAKKGKNDHITIGFGASLGHRTSIESSGFAHALARLMDARENVRMRLVGDRRLLDYLPVPKHKVQFMNYVPFSEWCQIVAGFDIFIAPLFDKFDMRRSFIKAEEACLMQIPLVATGDELYPVYKDFYDVPSHKYVPSELTVPDYDKRVELWYEALLDVVDNLDSYRHLALDSREYGLQFDVDRNVHNIIRTYEDILRLV